MHKTLRFRVVTILIAYDNDRGDHSLMAILQQSVYETLTDVASLRLCVSYARAGANPNARAYGLGTALSAHTNV